MAKKKRTKKYGRTNTLAVLNRRSKAPFEGGILCNLRTSPLIALSAMSSGDGNETLWNTLAFALNMARVMAENGSYSEALQVICTAQDALIRARLVTENSLPLDWRLGIHTFAVACAIRIYDQQMTHTPSAKVLAAYDEVHRRNDVKDWI